MEIVGTLRLRAPTLAESERVYPLSLLASKAKNNSKEQLHHLKELLSCLAEPVSWLRRFFGWYRKKDLRYLNDVLKKQEFMQDKTVNIPPEELQEKFNQYVSYIAAMYKMPSSQFKAQMKATDLERDSIAMLSRDIMKTHDLIMAYHAPKEKSKELQKTMRKLKSQSKQLQMKFDTEEKTGTKPKGKILSMDKLPKHGRVYKP